MKNASRAIVIILIICAPFLIIGTSIKEVHAATGVNSSLQCGNVLASGTNTVLICNVATASSSQLAITWVTAGGTSATGYPTSLYDNESNYWPNLNAAGGSLNAQCGYVWTYCQWGAILSTTVSHSGHDQITITFIGVHFFVAMGIADITGGAVYYEKSSTGNSNTGSTSNLAVASFTPTAADVVLTAAYVATTANTYTAGTGYTLATGQGTYPSGAYYATSEYNITSTHDPTTTSPETSSANIGWYEASVAFLVKTGVTQAFTVTTPNAGPTTSFGITGCGVNNATISGDSYAHTYTGLSPSCVVQITGPALNAGTFTRYCFSDRGTCVQYWTITTAAMGTGSPASNSSYYQLENLFTMNPNNPLQWDATYSETLTGTFLGTGSSTLATFPLPNGGTFISEIAWTDYGQIVTFPSTFSSTAACGGTWTANPPNLYNILAYQPSGFGVNYFLSGAVCTTTILSTSTIVGINAPDPAHLAAAIGPEVIPLFVLGLGMLLVYSFRIRGDFGVTIMLAFFFGGNLLGMLSNGGSPITVGVIPFGLTAESGVFLILWLLAGGATSSR